MKVFVFASNGQGFHGAGSAGFAMRGDARNTWRMDQAFLRAMKAPVGHPDRIGKLAVFGVARGFQQGREGASYAIQTVTRPGARRSIPLPEIERQLHELWRFAREHSEMTFKLTPIGTGYAGYTSMEMRAVLERVIRQSGRPENIAIPHDLYLSSPDIKWT